MLDLATFGQLGARLDLMAVVLLFVVEESAVGLEPLATVPPIAGERTLSRVYSCNGRINGKIGRMIP